MKIYIITILFCCSLVSYGQEPILLSGKVTFDKNETGVPFGYVTVKGTALGTVTDAQGNFRLKLESKYRSSIVVFSYLGYESQNIHVSEIVKDDPFKVRLKEKATLLKEAVVTKKKKLDAVKILKEALRKIDKNYHAEAVNFEGYYRETVKENNASILYADAVCQFHFDGYSHKKPKWKSYDFRKTFNSNSPLVGFSFYDKDRLHSGHFGNRTFKNDQVKIIEARASENLSKTRLYSSIEGGPIGLVGNDRVKYQQYFTKYFKFFQYNAKEVLAEDGRWYYLVSFHSLVDTTNLQFGKRVHRKVNTLKNSGKIWIDQESKAITKISYFIPTHLKKFICENTANAIRHFDYKVDVIYKKHEGRYMLDYIRREDEFIYYDSISDNTIPYKAISELQVTDIKTSEVNKLDDDEIFINSYANQLFNYPLSYNQKFWDSYQKSNPSSVIKASIRSEMEYGKKLEVQFVNKVTRDDQFPKPIAEQKPYEYQHLGKTYQDPYNWLKDTINPRSNEQVMDYLEDENKYAENYFIPLKKVQRTLFRELIDRVEKTVKSLPTKIRGYHYYYRYLPDEEQPRYYRKKIGSQHEELLLDVVEMAKDRDYYSADIVAINPGNNIMGFIENTDGSDVSTLKFMNLDNRQELADSIKNISSISWKDSTHFFYSVSDKKTNRSYQVKYHKLGTSYQEDELIYEESDPRFSVIVSKTKSKSYFIIQSGCSTSSETYIMPHNSVKNNFKLIHARQEGLLYNFSHYQDKFYIYTNLNTPNYEVMVTDTARYQKKYWTGFIAGKKGLMLTGFVTFKNFFVVSELKDARNQIRVINSSSMKSYYLKSKWDLAFFGIGYNPDFDTDSLEYTVSAPLNPGGIYSINMVDKQIKLVKKKKSSVNTRGLKAERVWANGRGGTKIPITVIFDKRLKNDKSTNKKMYLKSYGAYGSGSGVGFNEDIFSLLKRGFTVATAHVRGGSDLGMKWYEDGRLLNKKNTFHDFIDCTEQLIENGFATAGKITIHGGSAGGLLVGAVANMRPDLYKAVLLDVPFVDVINTMLDDQLPLTVSEYDEWGNPHEQQYFDYMKSYSPYDNVKIQDYPAMFFFTGLHDTRVGYWESAKMVAKLRKHKTDDQILLLKTNFSSGHGGSSGRFSYYRDLSYKYALIFDLYK